MKSSVAATLAYVATAGQLEADFMEHIVAHGKEFNTVEEYMFRKTIFAKIDAEIKAENAKGNNYTLGHNAMSTYTKSEWANLSGYLPSTEPQAVKPFVPNGASYSPVDWRDSGAVTPVKDQGQCGSCWSFSSTGSLEGAHQILTNELVSFSEQQFVDCAHYIAFGCNGGNEATAFNWAKTHGLMTEDSYPYTAVDDKDCLWESHNNTGINVSSFDTVTPDSADALKASMVNGPVSVNIEADKLVFQTYKDGVLDSDKCGTRIDHAVLAVGWGIDATAGEYWIVKNSWGASWGQAGYIWIAIVDGIGICGVQSGPSQPFVTA